MNLNNIYKEKNAKKPNNLINETSPYLLQHAYNPVDWYPWDEKAFDLAKKENKPIFLSIGYSTCHWCHVMEKESFEDEEIAKILNDNFISIKVDREEMPAVDSMYMDSAMIFTGSGGWPLTVIIDNDKKPFFAGTYYPKISLIKILNDISDTWKNNPNKLKNIASEIINDLNNLNNSNKNKDQNKSQNRDKNENKSLNSDIFDYSIIEKGFENLKERFDPQYGGFGYSPKFPSVQNILFLNRYYIYKEDNEAKNMVEKTLNCMFNGGIFDHIGGGFSRYSVDGQWLVPHFEKMMYDNGMLAMAYLEAGLLFDKKYLKIAKKILDFSFREMLGENGFYTAQDADSEGKEGKYYLFTINDIRKALGNSDAEKFCKIFDITREGNFGRKNIPNLINIYDFNKTEYNKVFNGNDKEKINDYDFNSFIEQSTKKLYEYRLKRIPPFKDEKNLSFVNGLMIATLSLAGNVLHNNEYISRAEEIGDFILNKLYHNGMIYTSYKDGKLGNKGVLDDYSYVVWGFIELYKTTFNKKWLSAAEEITNNMINLFFEDGNLYLSTSEVHDLPIRTKNAYDGAIPSGNNIAIINLMNLYFITNNNFYKNIFENILSNLKQDIERNPLAFITLLSSFIYNKTGGIHINLYIDPLKDSDLKATKNKIDFWNPFLTMSVFNKNNEGFSENMVSICENMVCKPLISFDNFSYVDIISKTFRY